MKNRNLMILLGTFLVIACVAIIYDYSRSSSSKYQVIVDSNNTEANNVEGPIIKVSKQTHDFGIVKYGDVVEYIFQVKNVGDEPLERSEEHTSELQSH